MPKPATMDADKLINEALLKIARADGAVRLSGKGDYPPIFASAAGASKAAIARLKNEGAPLVTEVGKGKSLQVKLTVVGLGQIADVIPEDEIGPVARRVVETLSAAEQVAFLQEFLPRIPSAAPELEPLLADAVQRQEVEAAERVKAERQRAERAASSQAALQRCLMHLAKLQAGRIEELREMLLAAGGTVPEMTQPPKTTSPGQMGERHQAPPEPATDEERQFRRDVAERLVSSWRDAVTMKKDEAQRFLETALDNISGLRRVGEEGEQVRFDGALHKHVAGVFTDHPVKVIRSGWALEDGEDRKYVIEKALVAK